MIYITGDIHGNPEGLFSHTSKKLLKPGDSIIVCGDFGMPWGGGSSAYHKYWLDLIATKPYSLSVLVAGGNT